MRKLSYSLLVVLPAILSYMTSCAQSTTSAAGNDDVTSICHASDNRADVTEHLLKSISRDVIDIKNGEQGGGLQCNDDVINALTSLRSDVSAIRSSLGGTGSYFPARNETPISDDCIIDMVSWGHYDGLAKGGHIRANWTRVQNVGTRGIYLAVIDPVTCTGTPFPLVNPCDVGVAQAAVLITYINLLVPGQIVAAATADEPRNNLQTAYSALASLGVQNLSALETHGKFSFIAQKGNPNKTVSSVVAARGGNLWLVIKLQGSTPETTTFKKLNP